ncbi:MAG TPA: NAD-binding protein [Planctomycetaceae bacterium]|nr:NAD-binding protein [Planctomycetaceae bacterium]
MRIPSRLQISYRFGRYLLWEFRRSLTVLTAIVLGGGLLLKHAYHHHPLTYSEACYGVFLLIFLEPYLDFPDEWYLQPLFFLIPIVGLGAIADSVVRLAYLVFTHKRNVPEWQRMVASLYRNHVVVLGVGKVGGRIIKGLLALKEPVVAIERQADSPFLDELHDLNVPVITGDGRQQKTLEQAGVAHARAVILASDDDLVNLDAALTAHDLNPDARIVLRLFDETLATKVAGRFDMPAISTSRVAAPAFVAAATGRKVYHDFQLAGRHLHLIDLTVEPDGRLAGRTVGDIQSQYDVNIVMHQGASGVNVNPGHDLPLAAGDVFLVMATMERLIDLQADNRLPGKQPAGTTA